MTRPAATGSAPLARLSSSLPLVLWLTAVWVGLWGSVTPANVLGGLALALVLVAALPLTDAPGGGIVRPAALLRFSGQFAVDLVTSSAQVVHLALRPRLELRPAVVAVRVPGASDGLLTLLANAISLTPGTLTLEVHRPTSTLLVHVLDVGPGADAVDRVRHDLAGLERLAVEAVGSAPARRALEADPRRRRA